MSKSKSKDKRVDTKRTIQNMIFTPFSWSRWLIIIFTVIGMINSFFIMLRTDMDTDSLKELSGMVINIQFLLAALIISIVSINPEAKAKENINQVIILKYIGTILSTASIGVFGYGLSYYVDIIPGSKDIIKLYSVIMTLFVNGSIIQSLKYIIRIFNLRF